jgi:Fe-S cluster assembly ATP-binding protein
VLKIENLFVCAGGKEIIKNLSLCVKKKEKHVIFGPNASGKTTLATAIMGIPSCKITSGKIFFNGKEITKLSIAERAKLGIFLAFQNPPQIRGVTVGNLMNILSKHGEKILQKVQLNKDIASRELGIGFSGGERKRLEIAQAFAVKPNLLILDEVDSGVDIESLKLIGSAINKFLEQNETTLIAITHYGYLLNYLNFDVAHVMIKGRIACSGEPKKIWEEIEKRGYRWCERCLKK